MRKYLKMVFIALAVLVLFAFVLPIGASIANDRISIVGYLHFYDTNLPVSELTPEMLSDATFWLERYSTNPMVRIYGVTMERRMSIISVDISQPKYPKL